MFQFSDLFQWERFITPSIIKPFYWLAIGMTVLFGLSGIASALSMALVSPLTALATLIGSVLGTLIGIVVSRITAEFILIVFRINDHLGALRHHAER